MEANLSAGTACNAKHRHLHLRALILENLANANLKIKVNDLLVMKISTRHINYIKRTISYLIKTKNYILLLHAGMQQYLGYQSKLFEVAEIALLLLEVQTKAVEVPIVYKVKEAEEKIVTL